MCKCDVFDKKIVWRLGFCYIKLGELLNILYEVRSKIR
jgi:hypothetical protein